MDNDVTVDIQLIIKLDKYTKDNNQRNYNKNLISQLS